MTKMEDYNIDMLRHKVNENAYMVKPLSIVLDSCHSTKIKHLHLVRCEVTSPSQDCFLVLYSTWDRVARVAKVGV